mmetsp:Transcript_27397/g.31938  ORF Transcript_27397/g.31938 Transcript_27397/m.31938 type:complete len:313 (+) Transcript_27397:93-1031(+)
MKHRIINPIQIKVVILHLLWPLIILLIANINNVNAQQQDPTTLNGGSILAMAGKNCVAVAVDKRFGSGPQTINVSPRTVLLPHSRVMVGFTGLEGDVQSLASELSILVSEKMGRHLGFGFDFVNQQADDGSDGSDSTSSYINKRGREISPTSMSMLLSHVLYGRRRSPYYVEPIVAGLEKRVFHPGKATERKSPKNIDCIENKNIVQEIEHACTSKEEVRIEYVPFLCAQDVIGAQSKSSSFVCSGAASKSLYGTAEAMWRPELTPDELVQVCGRAFLSALERDCLSGYGAIIYLIVGGKGITEIDLACRND